MGQPRSQWSWSVLAFCEAVVSGQLRSRLRSRLASGVIRFGQAVATKSYVISEATWDSRAFTGDDQCWPSARLSCRGTSVTA